MAEQEKWFERRQRMVRCKTHGLHFDPQLSSGCVLCVKEWSKLLPQRAPQFTIVLLCVLGMAVILYQVFGPGRTVGGPLIVEEEPAEDPRLDPEPYRPVIETLETGLFTTVEDRRDLADAATSFAAAARQLAGRIQRLDPSHAGTASAVAMLGASASEELGFAELERLRDNWLRLRRHQYLSADWFRSPVAEGSARDRVMLAEHREVARGLRALLYEAAAEAQSIADSEDGSEGQELWREFAADWRRRLDELWSGKPQRPSAAAASQYLIAIQELERAFQGTRTLASDLGLVNGSDPGARFDEVVRLVDEAENAFDGVEL